MSFMYQARRLLRPTVRAVAETVVRHSSVMARLTAIQHEIFCDHIDLSRPNATPADEALRGMLELITPCGAPDSPLIRVGAEHDGGYVMADDFRDVVLLSMGVGWDDSWEAHALTLGAKKCLQFDHTIRRPPRRLSRTTHIRLAIAESASSCSIDLASILARDDIAPTDAFVVKMDIEGSEWRVLSSAPHEFLGRCRQLVVEFHEFRRVAEPEWADMAMNALRRIREFFVPIHIHANNAVNIERLGSLAIPDALEITFVSKHSVARLRRPGTIRSHLDRPSDPRIPEVSLEGLLAVPWRPSN